MKTYQAIKIEIARLEKQAEALRQHELKAVIAGVKKSIADYGLTPADLGLGPLTSQGAFRRRGAAKGASGAKKPVGAPKYRDPASGKTWTGHGRAPAWIAGAKSRDAFLIVEPVVAKPAVKKAMAARKAKAAVKRAKPAAAKKKAARKGKPNRRMVRPAAVQIESGAASE
jgi:DNA-binding protein H-NS